MDKKLEYFEEYLKFGFTSIVGKNTVKPWCVLCYVAISDEFVKPSKFIRHLEIKLSNTSKRICLNHKGFIQNRKDFFKMLVGCLRQPTSRLLLYSCSQHLERIISVV